jgi:hypothetical protein
MQWIWIGPAVSGAVRFAQHFSADTGKEEDARDHEPASASSSLFRQGGEDRDEASRLPVSSPQEEPPLSWVYRFVCYTLLIFLATLLVQVVLDVPDKLKSFQEHGLSRIQRRRKHERRRRHVQYRL